MRGCRIAAFASASVVAGICSAAPIASDDFNAYTVGAQVESGADNTAGGTGLNGGTGFTSPYNVVDASKSTVTIQASGGSNALRLANGAVSDNLLSRAFPAQTSTVYYSATLRTNNPLTDEDFLQLGLSGSPTGEPPVAVGLQNANVAPSRFFVRLQPGTVQQISTTDVAPDTTYLLVGKASMTGGSTTFNRIDLFVNPSATEPTTPTATASLAAGTGPASLSNFIIRTARVESTDEYFIDNLRLGTTYADVIPEPASAGLLAAAAVGLLGRRRQRRTRRTDVTR